MVLCRGEAEKMEGERGDSGSGLDFFFMSLDRVEGS